MTTAYLKAIMEVYGKTVTDLGPVSIHNAWYVLCQELLFRNKNYYEVCVLKK